MINNNIKTLSIIGKGQLKVSPDLTTINIKFDEVLPTYKEALKKSVSDSKEVRKIFTNLGFDLKDLKTTTFDIRTKYEDEYNNGKRKSVFKGYQYNQGLVIKFNNDNTLLNKILTKLSNCVSNPKFSISYEVKNREEVKKQAITKAVEDAINKANIIAQSANISLDSIEEINYGDGEYTNYSRSLLNNNEVYDCCCMEKYSESDFDVELNPEDLMINEEVHISWIIK